MTLTEDDIKPLYVWRDMCYVKSLSKKIDYVEELDVTKFIKCTRIAEELVHILTKQAFGKETVNDIENMVKVLRGAK